MRGQKERERGWRGLLVTLVLALVWWILTGGDRSSWLVGLPALVLCLVVIRALPSEGTWQWRARGVLHFLPFFLAQSVMSGVQVAWLAMKPKTSLDPFLLYYDVRLPTSPARVFFANAVSLLPGTLSCILTADLLVIHVLNRNASVSPALASLESKVARLFGLVLPQPRTDPRKDS